MSHTLLKVIEAASPKELEADTNAFIKESGKVYAVVNMRVYPCDETVGTIRKITGWICYIIYKEKYPEES